MSPKKSQHPPRRLSHIGLVTFCMVGLLLTGCGIRGSLKTPPPIWGEGKTTPTEQAPQSDTDTNPDSPDT